MKPNLLRPWLRSLGTLLLTGAAFAQTPPTLENDIRNVFSQEPKTSWPPPPPSILVDPRTPTPNQFRSGTILGGWQTTRIHSTGETVFTAGLPSANFGTDRGQSAASSEAPSSAFDGSLTTKYVNNLAVNATSVAGLLIDSGSAHVVSGVSIITGDSFPQRDPAAFKLYGSNTSTTTGLILIGSGSFNVGLGRGASSSIARLAGAGSFRYYRLELTPVSGNILEVAEVQLRTIGTRQVVAGSPSTATGATTLQRPSGIPLSATGTPLPGQGVQQDFVTMSTPLMARSISYALGGEIAPPVFSSTGRALTEAEIGTFYLPQPQNYASGKFYYSPHAQKVFATQPGVVDVVWVERASGATYARQYVIAASPTKPVRRMYWTENGFKGPIIQIPSSRVSTVNVVYNSLFPATVTNAYVRPGEVVDPNVSLPPEKRTLWFSTLDNSLHAYNHEGRVFIELLGAPKADGVSREFLGYEIVEVLKETRSSTERVSIGDELVPLNNETDLVARVIAGNTNVDGQGAFLYEHFNQGTANSRLFAVRKTTPLFSAGVEIPSNEVLLYWMERGDLGLLWPKYYAGYIFDWPTDLGRYSIYARSLDPSADTAVQLNSADSPALVYQDDPTRAHAQLSTGFKFSTTVTSGTPVGRSLIRYTNGSEIWFERVYSQLDTTFAGYTGTPVPTDVGQRIQPVGGADTYVGYIRQASGTAFNPSAYKDPFVVGFDEAAKGAIIGVNALPTNNILEIWWYKRSTPPGSAIKGTYWPSFVQRYQLRWPTNAPEIVLASNAGSGDLPSLQARGTIYFQNDRTLPGYNPNEEHALMLNGRAWALRDDLNLATSSERFVLVQYTAADDRPAMLVFAVLREKVVDGHVFSYNAEAGKVLQAPMPLPILPLPTRPVNTIGWRWTQYFNTPPQWFPTSKADQEVANHEVPLEVSADAPALGTLTNAQANPDAPRYGQFTFLDRKGTTWVYRGMHNNATTATFGMRYFYRTQPGFFFPELATQPEVGTVVPYIRKANTDNPVTGEPLTIQFRPVWPAAAPELRIGETLTRPKYGLPAVRGQTSAEIIYQQSIATDSAGALTSATLFDPTRAKTYAFSATTLAAIPASAATDVYLGKTYFTRLPPHLSQRFYFDPNMGAKGSLVLKGEFKQEALGEDYLLLNVLGEEDITALKGLVDASDTDKAKWNAAIDGLATSLETFKEDPAKRGTYIVDTDLTRTVSGPQLASITNDDTAVDSYAVCAVGGGQGYVVMAVGNGRAFTPVAEPVSLYVFKVVPPLYRGELKIVQSSNPLDEKLSLQHSGDFAGMPEGYDFEWMYAPPVDGIPPALYTFTRALLLGNAGSWRRYDQPPAAFTTLRLPETNTDLFRSGIETTTPAAVSIRDSRDTADHGATRPQAILRRQFDVSALPMRAYLSVQLGNRDGAEIYLNQARVAVINRAAGTNTATVSSPGSDYSPLPLIYEIPATILRPSNNVITIELYTDSDLDVSSQVNVRIEGSVETVNLAGWLAIPPAPGEIPGETSGSIKGKPRHVIQGNSILTLTDNYVTMRYRARLPSNAAYAPNAGWSKWTDPQLAEGWIKRALAGINPFQQRVTNLFSNTVDTSVSLVQQAGRRWEGDIALNLSNINAFGLIEIYETILRRGKALSIEGTPAINYGAANDALLLAAGYLSDLYMIHGNEAFADAANPTIAYGLDNGTVGDVATSLFAFKGQLANVLDEELALLRGRDSALQPGTRTSPIYNRLVWNYTRGIDSGEAVYALNYNIKDMDGDGTVGAADAAKLYPQGHGDAYGHYLTAITGYYGLLANSNFSWTPRTEAVTVLGKPVQVDYFDERKFARSAVALSRTAHQILDLTYRQSYTASGVTSWSHLKDTRTLNGTNRRWGFDDWAVRGGQGAYFHWLVGNSMLPAVDPDPTHEGIQKVDRTTVPELSEIVAHAGAIQQSLSNADSRLNPLGLVGGALAFDISPADVDGGITHFEQIYSRATIALQNTITAFNNAKTSTQFLRQQEDSLASAREAIDQQEQAYTNQLIEIYGTPYPDDIGPGKTFVQGYAGPDLIHYRYVDVPEGLVSGDVKDYSLLASPEFNEQNPGVINYNASQTISFTLDGSGEYRKPAAWAGRRQSPGLVQTAVSDLLLARLELYQAMEDYSGLKEDMDNYLKVFNATITRNSELMSNLTAYQAAFTTIEIVQQGLATAQLIIEAAEEAADAATEAAKEAPPAVVGLANDATSGIRAAVLGTKAAVKGGINGTIIGLEIAQKITEQTKASLERLQAMQQEAIAWNAEYAQLVYDLRETLNGMLDLQSATDAAIRRYDQAVRNLRAQIAAGERVQSERETFRRRAAALIQGYRTKDLGFRAFRDESLEKYKQLFDLSARYAYLAATAYDYETGLLNPAGNSTAATFMDKVVKARSPGVVTDGVPQFGGATAGDPGLAGALAQLNSDWSVVKSRLGFNNPDRYRTTFSLRAENFRVLTTADGDAAWREILLAARRDNLMDDPDAARYCLNLGLTPGLSVPGFIIEFTTTIAPGFNFFGQPLAGGDSTFSATSFATKIRASGIAFAGYNGMTSPSSTASVTASIGASSPSDPFTAFTDSTALSATPYVYLVPAGVDSMRSPLGNGSVVRRWSVEDQAVPLPFNVGGAEFTTAKNWSFARSLSESFTVRQHQAFRAVPDGTVFSDDAGFTNARLIGRSVWNSRWKLIIPGQTLLSDPRKGMQIFSETVKDIKLHFETYSTAGN
jgi:hypothetical protein